MKFVVDYQFYNDISYIMVKIVSEEFKDVYELQSLIKFILVMHCKDVFVIDSTTDVHQIQAIFLVITDFYNESILRTLTCCYINYDFICCTLFKKHDTMIKLTSLEVNPGAIYSTAIINLIFSPS